MPIATDVEDIVFCPACGCTRLTVEETFNGQLATCQQCGFSWEEPKEIQ